MDNSEDYNDLKPDDEVERLDDEDGEEEMER